MFLVSGAQFNWKINHHEKPSHQKVTTKKIKLDFHDDFHDDFRDDFFSIELGPRSMFALESCSEIRFGRVVLFGRDEDKRRKLRDFARGFIREHRLSQQKKPGNEVRVCDLDQQR